jgi:hypothetical protein
MDNKRAVSRKQLWIGRVITTLVVLFLIIDLTIHIMNIAPVVESMTTLGYPTYLSPLLGVLELVCLGLYLYPRTSVLGAILWTGYLGGAVASNLRIEGPLFSHILFPVYIGLMLWGGLYLKDEKLRALIPVKR